MASHAFLSPSPVWDASLQRSKILTHALDATVVVDGVTVGLIVEPLIAADPDGGRLQAVRVLRVGADRPVDPAELSVSLAGADVPVRSEPVGVSGLRLLVPEVDGPTPLVVQVGEERLEVTLMPQRHYDIHLVQHSHYDIGYTDRQHVVRAQHLGYIDAVLRLIAETDDLPDEAKFRWNEEALFSITDWLAQRPASAHEELFRRVGEGRISLSAMPFNLHLEMCSTDELHELLRPASEIKQRYGIDFTTAMQTDVPGQVIGLPDALAGLGVRHLSVAHNWAGRSDPDNHGQLQLPRLFRWVGPEGGELLVWRTDSPHGLAYMEGPMVGLHESYAETVDVFPAYLASLGTRPYPLPVGAIFGWLDGGADISTRPPFGWDLLHVRTHGRWSDNAGPSRSVSDIAAEWNSRWLYPRLRVSTNEAFFAAAEERLADQIPTHTGDWNDWWAHGVGAAAAPVGLGRQAQNDLADAQTLDATGRLLGLTSGEPLVDADEGYRQLALWDEHTWGAADSWQHDDHGGTAGEHQWYWKVARAYAALDEAQAGLQQVASGLAPTLPTAEGALVSVYAFNPTSAVRTDELEFFLPASIGGRNRAFTVHDGRTGDELAHSERDEPAGSRGLGRYVRVAVGDVPAVGYVRVDVRASSAAAAETHDEAWTTGSTAGAVTGAEALSDPTRLENDFFAITVDLTDGTLSSVLDKTTGRELVNTDAALGFNAYVYDRYATIGQSNHNSSKFVDSGNLALISSRDIGGPAAVVSATSDERGQQVTLEQLVKGAERLRVTYRLPAGVPHLEISNRLRKGTTWDKESAFFAFPFAVDDPEVLEEAAGGLTGPDQDQVPGGAEYMRAIRHFVSIGSRCDDHVVGWASAEAPLVEIGAISLPYVPFPELMPVHEPATIYSWVHNNIWDTNFPVEQEFETDFTYRVAAGTGRATVLAARTASSLVQPLRPVFSGGSGDAPASGSVLTIDDPRVRLVGLRRVGADQLVVRLVSLDLAGVSTTVRIPGVVAASESSYLGEPGAALALDGDAVPVTFTGSGARAILVSLG